MQRRKFLISAVAGAASVQLAGCGGSGGGGSFGEAPPSALPGAVVWDPAPLLFLAGSFSSIDLTLTLPAGIRRGGIFGLAPNSDPLPPQLTLSPSGVLSSSGPPVSFTSNVVFTYQEP